MAKRPETMFKRLQKDGKMIQEDRDKSAKRPGKMQRDEKRSGTILKRWQKDPENGKDVAKRPRIMGKSRPEIWQKDAELKKDGKKTQKDSKRRQKDPARWQ